MNTDGNTNNPDKKILEEAPLLSSKIPVSKDAISSDEKPSAGQPNYPTNQVNEIELPTESLDEQRKRYERERRLTRISILVSSIAALFSGIVCWQNIFLIGSSRDSAMAAMKAVEQQRINDSTNSIYTRYNDSLNRIALELQIQSLNQGRFQYKTTNAPILQVKEFSIRDLFLSIEEKQDFQIMIDNLGVYPVKILSYGSYVFYRKSLNDIHKINSLKMVERKSNFMGTKEEGNSLTIKEGDVVTPDISNKVYSDSLYICLSGYVNYANLADNNKQQRYEFLIAGKINGGSLIRLSLKN